MQSQVHIEQGREYFRKCQAAKAHATVVISYNFTISHIVRKSAKFSLFRANICATWAQPGVNLGQLDPNLV